MARIDVLDCGFVELVDHMGGDLRVVEAARVTRGGGADVADPAAFIARLWSAGHTSPFEQVVLTFRVKCPIFVARQWQRHRTARIMERSMRYVRDNDEAADALEFYTPEGERLTNFADECWSRIVQHYDGVRELYRRLLECCTPVEVARCVLPLSTYTEFIWQMDLHNLLHFLKLRLARGAQWEIRQYAKAIKQLTAEVAPLSVAAALEGFDEGD